MLAPALPRPAHIACDEQFLTDAIEGLSSPRKTLPPKYLYDAVGSALFEAITVLPEYGLTRADTRLITQNAQRIARIAGPGARVVELGSGSGRKTAAILRAFRMPVYEPIDVSAAALEMCRKELMPFADVRPHVGTYLDGMAEIVWKRGAEPLLLLFLGSTIGNFEPEAAQEFLGSLRALLRPGDTLLIGFDLVKPRAQLLAAYDDPAGVTAAFNRNLLARMNRELGANFHLGNFIHEARFDEQHSRVEMHLCSRIRQTVSFGGRDFEFRAAETIWTESSYKFRTEGIGHLAAATGFDQSAQWIDSEWPFAACLWNAV